MELTSQKITGSTDRTDNSWHYLAGVRNTTDDKIYLYLDGASEATAVTDGTTATINSTNYLTIGCYNFGAGNYAGFFTGSIDETRISKAARSAAHIKANYYTQTDALVAWGSEETSKTTYTKTSQVKARVTQADQSATAQAKGRIEQLGISKISQAKARVSQNDNIQTNQTQGRIKKQ